MCTYRNILTSLCCGLLLAGSSCTKSPATDHTETNVLVAVGDSALTLNEVLARIPRGISAEDSARMFHTIVDTWVRDLALLDYAERNIPDIDRIEQMVERYRNDLIVSSYLASMTEADRSEISDKRLREYYDANRPTMILDQPLIKGCFLKVADNDPTLPDLRKWMSEFSEQSVDKIEKSGLRQASQYEYFRDEWHQWSQIADRIPYRFDDADSFLKSTRDFETTANGSTYLLHISEILPSGSEMPFEFARLMISEILRTGDSQNYRSHLIADIYRRQIKQGVLHPGLYDPISGKMHPTNKLIEKRTNNKQ